MFTYTNIYQIVMPHLTGTETIACEQHVNFPIHDNAFNSQLIVKFWILQMTYDLHRRILTKEAVDDAKQAAHGTNDSRDDLIFPLNL